AGAAQGGEVSAGAERLADVAAERADINTASADHPQPRGRPVEFEQFEFIDPYGARLQRHRLPRAGQLVSAMPADFQGAVDRRHLLDLAAKARQYGEQLPAVHRVRIRPRLLG